MVDEYFTHYPYQETTFISKLNFESPPFQQFSSYQNIQEVTQTKLTSENNNHLHIQPILNDYHQNEDNSYSTSIQSTEPSEYIPSQTHFIQETKLEYQLSINSSHIQSINMSSEENTDQNISNQEEVLKNSDTQSNEIKSDENETPITDSSLSTETNTSSNQLELNTIDAQASTEVETTPSLPDVVTETFKETSDHSNRQTEPDDILGNKSLLKQTITPGISDTRPTRNTLAIVSYQLFLIDNLTSNSRLIETIKNESFFVGEYDILPAIDMSIQLMDRGEHAIIDSDVRHCYELNGCEEKGIPPISEENSYRMKIDLELHDWKYPSDIQTLTVDERLLWSDKKRQRGNFLYRRKEYTSALQCYQNALKFVDITEHPLLENEENQSSILIDRYIQIQNNLAQVYLLNNKYEECLNSVDNVLKYDTNNIKALFRQAKALIELGNYDHALQKLKLLLQNPNKDIEKDKIIEMINFCSIKLAKYHRNEKEIYKRMFQSKSTTTTNEQIQIQKPKQIENKSKNWWTYVAVGSVALVAVGLAGVIKYR